MMMKTILLIWAYWYQLLLVVIGAPSGTFVVDMSTDGRRQVFEGVMVELQADSIGSNNKGVPGNGTLVPDDDPTTIGAPHDLTPSERTRFATEVLQGTRYVRLALGMYLRGLSEDGQNIIGRWPSQMKELKELQEIAGTLVSFSNKC